MAELENSPKQKNVEQKNTAPAGEQEKLSGFIVVPKDHKEGDPIPEQRHLTEEEIKCLSTPGCREKYFKDHKKELSPEPAKEDKETITFA